MTFFGVGSAAFNTAGFSSAHVAGDRAQGK
jgi:hypothetical protein